MLPEYTIQQKESRNCQLCEKPLRGRVDKRFCDDHCRNSFNNHLRGGYNNLVRNINNALGKNRRILERLLPPGTDTTKISKERMVQLGFRFKYLTHLYVTKSGKTYFYCYDYGYLPLDNDWFLVVKNKED